MIGTFHLLKMGQLMEQICVELNHASVQMHSVLLAQRFVADSVQYVVS